MYAAIRQAKAKPGHADELARIIKKGAVSIVSSVPGFLLKATHRPMRCFRSSNTGAPLRRCSSRISECPDIPGSNSCGT